MIANRYRTVASETLLQRRAQDILDNWTVASAREGLAQAVLQLDREAEARGVALPSEFVAIAHILRQKRKAIDSGRHAGCETAREVPVTSDGGEGLTVALCWRCGDDYPVAALGPVEGHRGRYCAECRVIVAREEARWQARRDALRWAAQRAARGAKDVALLVGIGAATVFALWMAVRVLMIGFGG